MKSFFTSLLLSFLFWHVSQAAPGDTTVVNVHIFDSLTYYGTYSRSALLPNTPGTTYRRIYLLYTIGKYQCPPGTQYCGSWDYSLDFVAKPLNPSISTDMFEIARGITPYATTNAFFPWTWEHTYYVDITDFAPILKDSLELRAIYSGYSGGFTLKTKVMYIEGIPERIPVSVHKVQRGYYNYGGATSIESNLIPDTTSIAPPATNADMLIAITGHGSDQNGCSEFCKKYYTLHLNGVQIAQYDVWKDCGFCDIQAQTGTWPYDRGNWCPGEKVLANRHHLTGVQAGTPFVVDMDMENYSSPNGGAGYSIASYVIGYLDPSFSIDAMIDDIITPSTKDDYKKYNENCTQPMIVIKNGGTTPLTSLTIHYGINQYQHMTYHWTGNLAFLQQEIITLPAIPWGNMLTDSAQFFVRTANPNGLQDEYALNDTMYSTYRSAPSLPPNFIIQMRTNNTSVTSGGPINESSWKLYDHNDSLIKQRVQNQHDVLYMDTLSLPGGCYKLIATDEGWEDGMNFWYYAYYPTNPGAGSIQLRNASTGQGISQTISRLNRKYYNGDFGSQFIYTFKVDFPTSLTQIDTAPWHLQLFPNPAQNLLYIDIAGLDSEAEIVLLDLNGRVLQQMDINRSGLHPMPLQPLSNGLYLLRITSKQQVETHKVQIIK